MRIIAGEARGRRLLSPEGLDVRPTTDKVKESMFNIIQFLLPESVVLDLFAGSGQLGIEALSRGAKKCVFIDNSKRSVDIIRKNIEISGFSAEADVRNTDSFSFLLSCREKFDIVILDPPYGKHLCDEAFKLLPDVLKASAVVICETRSDEALPENIGNLRLKREYVYSAIKLSLYTSVECERK